MSSVPMNLRRAHREQTAGAPWVYVLACGPCSGKLGVTRDPEARGLRLASELLWARFLGSAAFEAEQMLHGLLEADRRSGANEFYELPGRILAETVGTILGDLPHLEPVGYRQWSGWVRPRQIAYSEPVIRALNLSRLFRLPD